MLKTNNHAPASEAKGDESTARIPPRYWWLKRIGVGCVLLLIVLAGLRWWWGRVAHGRLQAEIDRVRAAGEPIFPEDFDTPSVPNAENAALVIQEAVSTFVTPPEVGEDLSKLVDYPTLTPSQLDDARCYVEANTNGLRLLRQARGMSRVNWGMRIRRPVVIAFLPSLSSHRQLARLLALSARYHHQIGGESHAFATVRDLIALGNAVDQQPTLISHLVAMAIGSLAARLIEDFTPTLMLGVPGPDAGAEIESARRRDVEALIADLLDERSPRQGMIRALQSERMNFLDMAQSSGGGGTTLGSVVLFGPVGPAPFWQRVPSLILKPLFELDGVELMHHGTAWVEAAKEPTWPAMMRRRPPDPLANSGLLDQLRRPFSAVLPPSLDRAAFFHHRVLTERRMAAIALAVRLHKIDRGRRPEQLIDLVPEYLDAVPLDPFAADGRMIGYRPDARPPLLYSIGPNGVDDDGEFSFRSNGGVDLETLDLPFFLDGNRPRFPSDLRPGQAGSGQGRESDQDKENNDADPEQDDSREGQP